MKGRADVAVINNLKLVAINRFRNLMKRMNKGYWPEYSKLLALITLIDNFYDIQNNKKYQEYLLNQE